MLSATLVPPKLGLNDFRPFCNGWTEETRVTYNPTKDSPFRKILTAMGWEFQLEVVDALDETAKVVNSRILQDSSYYEKVAQPAFIIDKSTGHRYLELSSGKANLRARNIKWLCAAPIIFPIKTVARAIANLFLVVSFYHFWAPNRKSTLSGKLTDTANEIVQIFIRTLFDAGNILCNLYGVFAPYNARKLETSLYRLVYPSDTSAKIISETAINALLQEIEEEATSVANMEPDSIHSTPSQMSVTESP